MKLLFPEEEIAAAISRLGAEINEHYRHGEYDLQPTGDARLVVIGVLNGAFIFMADLVRQLDIPYEVDFIRAVSYGNARTSSHNVQLTFSGSVPPQNRHVLLVEDVVDTGTTIRWLLDYYHRQGVKSVEVAALADKPSGREVEVPLTFTGLTVPDRFLAGYGMDSSQSSRGLRGIFACD